MSLLDRGARAALSKAARALLPPVEVDPDDPRTCPQWCPCRTTPDLPADQAGVHPSKKETPTDG